MKKSGLLLLVAMLFLVTTSISADSIGLFNPTFESVVLEAKISVQEEVAELAYQPIGEINADFSVASSRPSVFAFMYVNDLRMRYECIIHAAGGFAVRLKYPIAGLRIQI